MTINEIKRVLKEQKITYPKLAEMTGLSLSTITKIFAGYSQYPRVDTIEAIENALGLNKKQSTEETVSADEFALIQLYRSIGIKKGSVAQKLVVSFAESVLNDNIKI